MMLDINQSRRRTLVVCGHYPSFVGSGAQIRAAGLMNMLAAREDVYLVVIDTGARINIVAAHEMAAICKNILHINVIAQPGISNEKIVDDITGQLSCSREDIGEVVRQFYQRHHLQLLFVFRLESYFYLQREINQYTVKYLDLDELGSRKHQMIAGLQTKNGVPALDARQQQLLRMMEKKIIPFFDKVFVSSELEADAVTRLTGCNNVHVLPNIYPLHVQQSWQPAVMPREILFVGSFFYYPNEDAVLYFCRDILPLMRQRLGSDIIFRVVGYSMPASFKSLADQAGVQLLGYKEDIASLYARATLTVVPLRAGTGTRLKILEAFSYGCPVVSTSIGASGLQVTHGEHLLIADEPESFAQACHSILESDDLAARLREQARSLHEQSYSPSALLRCYDQIHP